MKKTKLLLAAPLMIAPVAAVVPFMTTSCSKNKTDFGKLEEYVDHEIISDGDSAFIYLKVKGIEKDRYLPSKLTSVSTNGKKLTPVDQANGRQDYYTYTPYDNNKEAVIYIFEYLGTVQIDAETATLKSISAQGYDVTGSGVAEFEIGEYFNSDTTYERVIVTAALSNGEQIELNHDDLEFTLDTYEYGKKFAEKHDKANGTVKYNNKTATFKFQVNDPTLAYYTYISPTTFETTVRKYSQTGTYVGNWKTAITAYNAATEAGYYHISLPDGKYTVDEPITIKQKNNQALVFEAIGDVTFDETKFIYPVEMTGINDTNKFTIVGDATAELTGIDISRIGFYTDTSSTNLVALGDNACDVLFDDCGFYASASTVTGVNGISSSTDVGKEAQNITIADCTGQNLATLYSGGIAHDDYSPYDLIISNSSIWDCDKLFNIAGSSVDAYIYNTYAEVIERDATQSGMTISGTGNYTFIDSEFKQGLTGTADLGFVEIVGDSVTDDSMLTFYHCSLIPYITSEHNHDVINNIASTITGADWSIKWTGFDEEVQNGKVYSNPTGTQSKTWTHK